jgi:hypothetical protein
MSKGYTRDYFGDGKKWGYGDMGIYMGKMDKLVKL